MDQQFYLDLVSEVINLSVYLVRWRLFLSNSVFSALCWVLYRSFVCWFRRYHTRFVLCWYDYCSSLHCLNALMGLLISFNSNFHLKLFEFPYQDAGYMTHFATAWTWPVVKSPFSWNCGWPGCGQSITASVVCLIFFAVYPSNLSFLHSDCLEYSCSHSSWSLPKCAKQRDFLSGLSVS